MNKKAFYASLRTRGSGVFGTSLTQGQVDGIETILAAAAGLPISHVAYLLATAYHETAHTMRPVRETLAKTDDEAIARLESAWKAGKLSWVSKPYWRRDSDGKTWLGRGYVQLTHKANYKKASDLTGVNLLSNPNRAMQPTVAAKILVDGCESGIFTGKKLKDYLPDDCVGARRVVNGKDRAVMIAGYAHAFAVALKAGDYKQVEADIPKAHDSGLGAIIAEIIKALVAFFGGKK
ncbi:hypothetical protein [Thioclava sp. DLFJ4-1]|uniref:hypothetical protein n=1 Tax=Thioclava sp. DLFJ4-1 TaxID=1915313 RepID=UPI0009CD5EB4|nr:hypothetical protein [Thioclava sp. DLFJ4-1]OOY15060.1 hypothetical protein BMI85_16050 [Thioclava sp. DLFJ4-1]